MLARTAIQTGLYISHSKYYYEVIGNALSSETLKEFTIFKPLYQRSSFLCLPTEKFHASITSDNHSVPCFSPIPQQEAASLLKEERLLPTESMSPCSPFSAGIYQHYKKMYYHGLGTARSPISQEEHVLYKALYGDFGLWIRPYQMFGEKVTIEGKLIQRFAHISEQNEEDFFKEQSRKPAP